MHSRWIIALLLVIMLAACAGEPDAPVVQTAPTRAAPTQTPEQAVPTQTSQLPAAWPLPTRVRRAHPTPLPAATPPPTPTPIATPAVAPSAHISQPPAFIPGPDIVYSEVLVPAPEGDLDLLEHLVDGIMGMEGLYMGYVGQATLDETILSSDWVARVSLVSKRAFVSQRPNADWDIWGALLEFRFRVHEYLKGSGPSEIGGLVYIEYYGSEAQAREGAAQIVDAHDSRWDAREAIVFLRTDDRDTPNQPAFPTESDQYWFGSMALGSGEYGLGDAYTVASIYGKLWLPEASPSTGGRAAQAPEKMFLLDAPANAVRSPRSTARGGASAATTTLPTISLANIKSRVAALEAEASAGGTPEHRACVENAYIGARYINYRIVRDGWPLRQHDVSMKSGDPAGTVIFEISAFGNGPTLDVAAYISYDGLDNEIARPKVLGSTLSELPPRKRDFTIGHVTTRPLPAGFYRFFYDWSHPLCPTSPPGTFNNNLVNLTVTPSERTLHEAFFDPVDIGDAVGADATNGVLKPTAFSLGGTTTTISSLKWEDGEVTMALTPTTTLADYAIDFIDTTGTTTLSLTSDNASTTPLTWTVADAPWAAGDLLMLRIQEPAPPPPVTVTITPRPEGRFTFFDLTVSWNDPQACDGRYFVYVGTDTWVIRNLGFHAASVSTVTYATGWRYDSVPDYWVFVRCDSSGGGQSRDVGRASLRAALE